jgi:muramoyltetrapeptide carboxypeptidase LdcA involved in peptidoglycan recycling
MAEGILIFESINKEEQDGRRNLLNIWKNKMAEGILIIESINKEEQDGRRNLYYGIN